MTGRVGKPNGAPRGLAGPNAEKSLSLALPGGGAHGAFTWGVLDAILEDGRLAIEAITGASAGSMNAVVLAEGWMKGGPVGAREQLRTTPAPATGAGSPPSFSSTPATANAPWSLMLLQVVSIQPS
jgi:predicted acylesterase/phospholipase RssA